MTAAAALPPLFERLAVFDDLIPREGALSMALDEVLLGNLRGVPLLRIYRWMQPMVSLGFFDSWQAATDRYSGVAIVRRWTGGGIVEHGNDATYSLLIPRTEALTNGPAGESYRLIHLALQQALTAMGWGKTVLSEMGNAAVDPSRACFANPVRHDLLAGNRKISGAAQRRTRWGLLHQGSVRRADGQPADADALASTLPKTLARIVEPRFLYEAELTAALKLEAEKYATEVWLKKK